MLAIGHGSSDVILHKFTRGLPSLVSLVAFPRKTNRTTLKRSLDQIIAKNKLANDQVAINNFADIIIHFLEGTYEGFCIPS